MNLIEIGKGRLHLRRNFAVWIANAFDFGVKVEKSNGEEATKAAVG